MIMKAIVIPRTTSRQRSLGADPGKEAGLADGACVTAALAAYGMADWRHSPNRQAFSEASALQSPNADVPPLDGERLTGADSRLGIRVDFALTQAGSP
jgi:hypothetical protein